MGAYSFEFISGIVREKYSLCVFLLLIQRIVVRTNKEIPTASNKIPKIAQQELNSSFSWREK